MKILVTGSAGHLGEALMLHLRGSGHEAVGFDTTESDFTHHRGSVTDPAAVADAMQNVDVVIHTAALHKPHVGTHPRQEFVDTNITGTLTLLEESVSAGVTRFVYTSTTSAFGDALRPAPHEPAAWITEDVTDRPKNIYGVTKATAEDLCELFARGRGLPCIVLRTSRFFPEEDDSKDIRDGYADANAKVNEFLYRRVDLEDVVDAHLRAAERASDVGFGRYIISATSPFTRSDLSALRRDAAAVVERHVPRYVREYQRRGWTMFPTIDRVYVNDRAREALGWQPRHTFAALIDRLEQGDEYRSPLTQSVGSKGYHPVSFADGPYPVE
ncbi:NAD(P)-dependent oxidoreductase [Mycobacterium sp. 21AC1]|uniref:NAD-dependent epimerase/dehydratase family protein n=1 Tax=[Mycobacterium] appelbergii TaxID=2939269 RepID=UPI002939314C|nr:NAD(P)-dependent oxidoreductase [Mycobacterium sp. 21AC1]MDV3123630.1 NAD(P)-dependent oxidoreductase [Mycobacterium sp. 21AC1]